jgi:hypothetical protein
VVGLSRAPSLAAVGRGLIDHHAGQVSWRGSWPRSRRRAGSGPTLLRNVHVSRNECTILRCEGNVCALWYKVYQSTKEAPNFLERRSLLKKSALSWLRPQMKLETPQEWRIGARSGMKACTEGVFQQAGRFLERRTGDVQRMRLLLTWVHKGLLICLLALRGRLGTQPQSDVSRLHGLSDHAHQFVVQSV